MDFKSVLQQEREIKIIEHALDFAENIQPTLIESSRKGFGAFEVPFANRDDAHILRNPEFLENIELLLDGCKAEVRREKVKNVLLGTEFYKHKLVITWWS